MEILPFTAKLPSNFGKGSRLKFECKPEHSGAWLSITLLDKNQILKDKHDELKHLGLFQVQLRYDENVVVLNSVGPGSNGDEQKVELVDVDKDGKVDVEIRVTNKKYKVLIGDQVIGMFNHNEDPDPEQAKYCNIYGEFVIKTFRHEKKEE